jgi:signal transduction histidine kinase
MKFSKPKRMTVIIYLWALLAIISTINRSRNGWGSKDFQTPVTIPIAIFVILFLLYPLLFRQSRFWTYIYMGGQAILVSYLLTIPPHADYFAMFYIALVLQAVHALPEKKAIRLAAILTIIMIAMEIYGHGFSLGIGFAVNYILAIAVTVGLIVMTERARIAREESQRLLGELQVAHEQLQTYSKQAEEMAVMEERNRLARELHDSVTQSLHSSTLMAEAGQRLAGEGEIERARGYLVRLGEISQQALGEMRLLVYELRPLALNENGLVGALQQRLDAVERRSGVDVQLSLEENLELPENIEEELFRVALEALNNAIKHASPSMVKVTLQKDVNRAIPCIELGIIDDGSGFDQSAKDDIGGLGLISMGQRIEKLGGELTIISAPGEGTQVKVCVDLEE